MESPGRKILALVIGTALLGTVWLARSQTSSENQNPTPPRLPGQPIVVSVAGLIAIHDAKSPRYNPDCLASGCHADIFNRTTLSRSIRAAHNIVERMGLTATDCRYCHESTEIVRGIRRAERGNAAKLGKQVDPGFRCYPCHGVSGPGKQLYGR
jgi:hypothetical protein